MKKIQSLGLKDVGSLHSRMILDHVCARPKWLRQHQPSSTALDVTLAVDFAGRSKSDLHVSKFTTPIA